MGYNLVHSCIGRRLNRIKQKLNPNGAWRIPSIAYTLEHKLAFLEREHYLLGKYTLRGLLHDWDKPFLYMIPFCPNVKLQKFHSTYQPHHVESPRQTQVKHMIELWIDMDCAPLTKADKQYPAFDVILHFYPHILKFILPVILAINPDCVSRTICEMDALRQKNIATYLFQSDAYTKTIYRQVVQIIKDIEGGLPDDTTIINSFEKDYPTYLKEMTVTQIFLKTLAIVRNSRKEKIDTQAMRLTLTRIRTHFETAESFLPRQEIPISPHDACQKMKHPFLIDSK